MKTISAALKAHKSLSTTTVCRLMQVECTNGTLYGFTDLDVDISYDDGIHELRYEASTGFMPSAIAMDGGLSVENADLTGIIASVETGIEKDTIRSGKLDYAKVRIYLVNYEDLSMGHEWLAYGNLGQVIYQDGQYTAEFRSRAQVLKQVNVCQAYSLICRAQYGDQKCGKPLVWIAGTVTSETAESTQSFTDSSLTQSDGYFVPGIVEFLSGQNAGKSIEVTAFAGGTVSFILPLYYPVLPGDQYQIRIDCNKMADTTGCKDARRWGTEWALHFRGEPNIPLGDAVQTPGAQL